MESRLRITEVSFGNLPRDVTARELAEFLEASVGSIARCKVKRSSANVPVHAFVHFESPNVAKEACNMAERGRLLFRGYLLRARVDERLGPKGFNSRSSSIIQLQDVVVTLGSVTGKKSFVVSWKGPAKGLAFHIDPACRRIRFCWTHIYGTVGKPSVSQDVMMELRIRDVRNVRELDCGDSGLELVLLLQLWNPPWIFYRSAEDDIYNFYNPPLLLPDDEDPWIRSIDTITPDKSIGRCLDFKLNASPRQNSSFKKVLNFFRDQRLLQKEVCRSSFSLPHEVKYNGQWVNPFFTLPHQEYVPFDLMFLVNAIVHRGIVDANNLNSFFYNLLDPDVTNEQVATQALREILNYSSQVFDATSRLQLIIRSIAFRNIVRKDVVISEENMLVRRLIITPTRGLCLPPEVERSNRVIRHYHRVADRFLRVSFLDDNLEPISSQALTVQIAPIVRDMISSSPTTRTGLYDRIVNIMQKGFPLCGRHYTFLAFSANQLRDSSAWFFAGNEDADVNHIRAWMGSFPGGNVAKYAARMGQCFSSTLTTGQVNTDEVLEMPDVLRNRYNFSDGCGKISPEFASKVALSLKLDRNPPSCYQIRYAGYKGVTSVWPLPPNYKLGLRGSMKKFSSSHIQFEVVGWSQFLPCFLNRQIITLLSTLKVDNTVFLDLQDKMVENLARMMEDRDKASTVLMTTCAGELHGTALRMLKAGFHPEKETHLRAMLQAIRNSQFDELIQKAKIFVPNGRWLLGCLDEIGVLDYGQCFVRVSGPNLAKGDDINSDSSKHVITGKVVMAKNPCMHPGDIRILEAVDIPALYGLVDCLVFPQLGSRPHSNEASGSDLDGDLYFTCWDPILIPPSGKSWEPMEYVTCNARFIKRPLTNEDVIDFFAQHMTNDSLGRICNAHVVHADQSPVGALDDRCLELAKLAAMAVDYPKTGKAAVMPSNFRPLKYPDFMQKRDHETYVSKKILGILFRKAMLSLPTVGDEIEGDTREMPVDPPIYDPDLEVPGFEEFVNEAFAWKTSYNTQLGSLMTQYSIAEEAQVVTGHVRLGSKYQNSRRQGDIKERVKIAYVALQKEYRNIFEHGSTHPPVDGSKGTHVQLKALDAKASAWYHVTYHPKWNKRASNENEKSVQLLSFAWIAADHLGSIKKSKQNT